jgi:CubicO group peptidase (beta-lactamase class C family)
VTENATGWPLEVAPGTRFPLRQQRHPARHPAAFAQARRRPGGAGFPYEKLFWKVGMNRTFAETDWQGNYILSSQVWTTARDLARMGLLYLNDGTGTASDPARRLGRLRLAQGRRRPAAVGFGYGATFWTFAPDSGVPADAYIAQGNRGQYLAIVPSRNIVIVPPRL